MYIPLPTGTKANQLDIKIGINDFKCAFKSNPSEPLIEGKWYKKVNSGECFWNIERKEAYGDMDGEIYDKEEIKFRVK